MPRTVRRIMYGLVGRTTSRASSRSRPSFRRTQQAVQVNSQTATTCVSLSQPHVARSIKRAASLMQARPYHPTLQLYASLPSHSNHSGVTRAQRSSPCSHAPLRTHVSHGRTDMSVSPWPDVSAVGDGLASGLYGFTSTDSQTGGTQASPREPMRWRGLCSQLNGPLFAAGQAWTDRPSLSRPPASPRAG